MILTVHVDSGESLSLEVDLLSKADMNFVQIKPKSMPKSTKHKMPRNHFNVVEFNRSQYHAAFVHGWVSITELRR